VRALLVERVDAASIAVRHRGAVDLLRPSGSASAGYS
jgi:hypothetical protein